MITEELIIQSELKAEPFSKKPHPLGDLLATFYLVIWFALAIYMVLVTLGLTQFSERETYLSANATTSFAILEQKILQEKALNNKLIDASKLRISQSGEIDNLIEEIRSSELALTEMEAILDRYRVQDGALQDVADSENSAFIGKNEYESLLTNQAIEKARQNNLLTDLEAFTKPVIVAQSDLDQFRSELTPELKQQIAEFEKFDAEKKRIKKFSWFFFGMPRELLTLVLTLSMGIFGSTIALSRQYFQSPPGTITERINWFLLRPMLGAVMALSIYILFKAGVLVFSASQTNGGVDGALNPFVIALLGIIGGLFSERAYSRLDQTAADLFRSNSTVELDHWAAGLGEIITDQGKSIEDLSAFVNEPSSRIAAWIEGELPIPSDIRIIFCRWLDKSPNDLFKTKSTQELTS